MATWQDRAGDAGEYWAAAEAEATAGRLRPALTLAFQAAIAANDAVIMSRGRTKPRGDNHAQAAGALQEALHGTAWEGEAAEKADLFRAVMRSKTPIEYSSRRLPPEDADRLLRQCGRFVQWAEKVFTAPA
jgi:hypothetical protein